MNLVLFNDVIDGKGDFIRQVALNIVMTIPLGFLFPLTQKGKYVCLKTIVCTFVLSLSIEFLQPLINGFRSSDITDVLTNTVGGIIGYLCYILFKPAVFKVLARIKSK